MSHSTNYKSFWGQFHGSNDPTNSVIVLKDNDLSTRTRANPTRLSLSKGKVKNVTKKLNIYSTMKTEVLRR